MSAAVNSRPTHCSGQTKSVMSTSPMCLTVSAGICGATGETIGARGELLAGIEQTRERDVNHCDQSQRPNPARQAASFVMPHSGGNDAGKRHRQHEFPGEVHDLIDARARQRPAYPNVNKK